MEYRYLGATGLRVSEISLGTWLTFVEQLDETTARACVEAALNWGINFIDTADVYASGEAERMLGRIIRDLSLQRQDLVLSSKVYWPMGSGVNRGGLSRKHIFETLEGSLRRLETDYLDIYFCHHPDECTPVEETVRAMDDLVHQGKVLYWGTSNSRVEHIQAYTKTACELNAYPPRAEQPHYCMLCEDRSYKEEILATCASHGMGVTVFSPLAQGVLTGKYNDGTPIGSRATRGRWAEHELEKQVAIVRRLTPLAAELGLAIAQLALAWTLRRPEVSTVIVGATKPEHIQSNALASGERLSADVLEKIDRLLTDESDIPN